MNLFYSIIDWFYKTTESTMEEIRKDTGKRFNKTNAWISRMAKQGKYFPELQMGDFHEAEEYSFKDRGW